MPENINKGSRKTVQRNQWIKNNEDKIHAGFFSKERNYFERGRSQGQLLHV